MYIGFPWWLSSKESACSAGDTEDMSLIPGSGWLLGGANGNLLLYSSQEIPMDRGAWWAAVQSIAKSRTQQMTERPVSIPILQFVSPTVSPDNQVCFLCLWVCFCCVNKFICNLFIYVLHLSNIVWYLSFCAWLTSLTVTISSSIHGAANGIILFFFRVE